MILGFNTRKKDNSKQTFAESVSIAIYSTTKAKTMAYVVMFESFWEEIELHRKLRD